MTPLLRQFLLEAHEGLETIDARLLALEAAPQDTDAMAALFRVVHTLKGNAGLFDVPELSRVLHAAEDLLSAVRRGDLAFGRAMADALLDTRDFVLLLLEDLEASATIPAARASDATRLAEMLRGWLDTPAAAAPAVERAHADAVLPAWTADALRQVDEPTRAALPTAVAADASGHQWWWIEYVPAQDAFFRGEDPLHLVRQVSEVVWQEILPTAPWPSLVELDPYRCQLRLRLLARASADQLDGIFRYVAEDVRRWPAVAASVGVAATDDRARLLADLAEIQAQILSLPDDGPHAVGRRRAATAVADRLRDALARAGAAPPVPAPAPPERAPDSDVRFGRRAEDQATTLRHLKVEPAKIDRLLQLIGELVVAKNALPFLAQKAEAGLAPRELAREIKAQHGVVHRIADELQDAIRQVRMVPMQFVFQRLPRLVRDLSARLGKDVRLVLEGETAEADKQIVEGLAEPLVHLVRNSLDHGFETPDVRVAAGKPAHGTLTLRATQGADRLELVITDDGRGIDPAVVRRKALAQGIVTAEALERLDDRAATELIFHSGFSTADAVSDISGRGVGMDAVRAAVEGLGGSLRLDSAVGRGTMITLALPLTMSVTTAMIVEIAGQRFGVPMDGVVETMRVPVREIHGLGQDEAMVRRGRVVPLRSAARLLGRPEQAVDDAVDAERAVLVVRHGEASVGLYVDAFHGREDILLSPMAGALAGLGAYAGTALLGDGSVLLVLNVRDLL